VRQNLKLNLDPSWKDSYSFFHVATPLFEKIAIWERKIKERKTKAGFSELSAPLFAHIASEFVRIHNLWIEMAERSCSEIWFQGCGSRWQSSRAQKFGFKAVDRDRRALVLRNMVWVD